MPLTHLPPPPLRFKKLSTPLLLLSTQVGIWIWTVDNLESIHYATVVRDPPQCIQIENPSFYILDHCMQHAYPFAFSP